ncbi:hypothetical protein [Streptacidiphilus sp. EB103A]|uniref:hypothetical protein n=1 Tax=Streptacidiphilus sp. EB103A TaxID=3156275 RepID=UPI003516DFF4
MPIETVEAIPLLAQIHLRTREHKEELWELAVRAFQAGATPASIARVMGLSETEIGQLSQALSAATADSVNIPASQAS